MARITRAVKTALGVRKVCPPGHIWYIYRQL
jgi:hypothetical protein